LAYHHEEGSPMTTTMREALDRAMGRSDGETLRKLHESGLAVVDQDSMSRAIHDVYCGIMADHTHPNEKDQEQARALIAAIQQHTT
jgi:hypothetical protein